MKYLRNRKYLAYWVVAATIILALVLMLLNSATTARKESNSDFNQQPVEQGLVISGTSTVQTNQTSKDLQTSSKNPTDNDSDEPSSTQNPNITHNQSDDKEPAAPEPMEQEDSVVGPIIIKPVPPTTHKCGGCGATTSLKNFACPMVYTCAMDL
jgi:hypothetical protein